MIPDHYSRDIAKRCQSLIRQLLPSVHGGLADDSQFGGSLGTTFLLALATPMIVFPIERLFKPSKPWSEQVGDDRQLDPAFTNRVDEILGSECKFSSTPFFVPSRWSYTRDYAPFNVAERWPDELLTSLTGFEAHRAAADATATRVLYDLRNALTHGGVAYLDANGKQTEGNAEMLAFAGSVIRQRKLVGLNILRVSETHFFDFLMSWADWLTESDVIELMNSQDPLAA